MGRHPAPSSPVENPGERLASLPSSGPAEALAPRRRDTGGHAAAGPAPVLWADMKGMPGRIVPGRSWAARAGAAHGGGQGRSGRGSRGRRRRLAPVPDPTAAAFFDVDNTLMRGASIYHFARGLAARKMFGPRDLLRLTWGQLAFRLRGAENADHIDAAREAALAFVAGHKVDDIIGARRGNLRRHDGRPDLGRRAAS